MSFVQNFPFFSIILCLLCAVTTFVAGDKWGRRLTIGLLSVSIVLQSCVLWFCASNNTSYSYMMGHFPAPWGNEIAAGVIEPLMALLFSVVMLLSVLGGIDRILKDIPDKRRHLYWSMVDLTLVSLLALSYTNDIFTGYVFIEICTIASCALLSARDNGRSLIAAARYMVFALVGSGLFLIGVIYTYSITERGDAALGKLAGKEAQLCAAGLNDMYLDLLKIVAEDPAKQADFIKKHGVRSMQMAAISSHLTRKGYIIEGGLFKRKLRLTDKGAALVKQFAA